jgi:prepilin-type N-terminal cleavage/methylation domain-containing protein/prepilin-type processing-associated H-X9-DG protein
MHRTSRAGYTLIELLVVIFIIAVLMSLLLPVVHSAREAARRIQCTNNLKQLGLAMTTYESTYGLYPPSIVLAGIGYRTDWVGGWSINGRILPFLEQNNLYYSINFSSTFSSVSNLTVSVQSVSTFICPSEVNPNSFVGDDGTTGVVSYGWCMGDWYVWGGFPSMIGRSAFSPNHSRRQSEFTDGLSNTMLASEVRARQFERTDCGGLAGINNPNDIPPPNTSPSQIPEMRDSGSCKLTSAGHTSWANGQVDQTGMTTAWAPGTRVVGKARTRVLNFDIDHEVILDLIGNSESKGGPTFAAVTTRSYHPGGVNVLLGDGSVRFVKENLDGNVWRSLGSVSGGEILSASDL